MDKRLIAKVHRRPLLYANDDVYYRDRQKRALAWREIGRDLGIPDTQCKEMWRKLRNCYLNAVNRRQSKSIPKWKYEDEMVFLLPFLELRPPESINMEQHSPDLSDHYGGGDLSIDPHPLSEDEMALSELVQPKMEPTAAAADEEEVEVYKRVAQDTFRLHRTPEKTAEERSETELFFMSIASTVERLPAIERARIKMQVCRLVCESEMRHIEAEYEETL